MKKGAFNMGHPIFKAAELEAQPRGQQIPIASAPSNVECFL